jgi:hypothetical protein
VGVEVRGPVGFLVGPAVGERVGALVGASVGCRVGIRVVGIAVGEFVGTAVGCVVGTPLGTEVGIVVGPLVGALVGMPLVAMVGVLVGVLVGDSVGFRVAGVPVGPLVGCSVGIFVGESLCGWVGDPVGCRVGVAVGASVGRFVGEGGFVEILVGDRLGFFDGALVVALVGGDVLSTTTGEMVRVGDGLRVGFRAFGLRVGFEFLLLQSMVMPIIMPIIIPPAFPIPPSSPIIIIFMLSHIFIPFIPFILVAPRSSLPPTCTIAKWRINATTHVQGRIMFLFVRGGVGEGWTAVLSVWPRACQIVSRSALRCQNVCWANVWDSLRKPLVEIYRMIDRRVRFDAPRPALEESSLIVVMAL